MSDSIASALLAYCKNTSPATVKLTDLLVLMKSGLPIFASISLILLETVDWTIYSFLAVIEKFLVSAKLTNVS